MMILACDASTKFLSIAIVKDDKVIRKYNRAAVNGSDYLFVVIDKLLKALKIKLDDFDLFAVGLGPGSFTGLRIALASFKTFAFCLNKPLVGITSFDAIASNLKGKSEVVCVIEDAKKNKLYAATYTFDKEHSLKVGQEPSLFDAEELIATLKKKTIFTGGGLKKYREELLGNKKFSFCRNEKFWYPRAQVIASLAEERFKAGKIDDPAKLFPLYLHSEKANITKPKKLV